MADTHQRSYLRDSSGPRAVDTNSSSRDKARSTRRPKDGDDKSSQRSKRDSNRRSPKKDSHRRKHSSSQSTTETYTERPYFELDVIGQPPVGIALGMPVETSVMISLRLPSADRSITTTTTTTTATAASSVDTSRLFAVASLVADSRSGERVPLEAGIMTGQKMFDSVHPIPDECAARLANNEPCRLVLGYFSFPQMLIRQSGAYRIRTTLIKMSASGEGGGSSVLAVDSEPVKVERRSIATPRRHQRVYS
ncbi:hypothetical protein B0A55_09017 [Friedmanniomyces simplex]|uniref:Velvet domain-containing protein n=1 Tax=Friedmanniomyces simplex TaxID=329884 RepID=A0A4U0WYB1_9PEZI|nr:hypothetical protein B0A55_09017 [Friedmanniomyces simplex]